MDRKPKVSPSHTYILDEDDIDHLDEYSLTTIMDEAVESEGEGGTSGAGSDEDESIPSFVDHDSTIDDLLNEEISYDYLASGQAGVPEHGDPDDSGADDADSDELLAHDQLFGDSLDDDD